MMTAQELQEKVGTLRTELIDVVEQFADENDGIPAQAVMAGLGELLIQFSVSQAGKAHTLHLLSCLVEVVEMFGDNISPHH